jgi:hypothetical protein
MEKEMRGSRFIMFLAGVLVLLPLMYALAQEATVVLKNTKRIEGKITEDSADHLLILSDIGEVKINRIDIARVLYQDEEDLGDKFADMEKLDDHVIVHMNNGDVFDGRLVAKGASALILITELGRLTVPKQDIRLVEYVSRAFAERGEAVRVRLMNGQNLDGYLYHEDRNSLTITTKNGRLTLDKEDLQSIAYNVPVSIAKPARKEDQYTALRVEEPSEQIPMKRRQDRFEFGYSSQFGDDYAAGAGFTYRNRNLFMDATSFSLNWEANLALTAFSLNQNVLKNTTIPGAVSASGAAVVTTLGLGLPLHFFPTEGAAYEFYFVPLVESHLVYESLNKEYPSYPTLNSSERETKIRWGLGTQVGIDWALNKEWRVGLGFNMHFLLKENDFNTISLHVSTRLY